MRPLAGGSCIRCVSPIDPSLNSGLRELEHEIVLRLGRVWRILISGVVRVAQETSLVDQLEPSRFDFLPEKRFLDAMQGTGFGDAGTRSTRVVSYDIESPDLSVRKTALFIAARSTARCPRS